MIPLFVPGRGWLHRVGARAKLITLAACAFVLPSVIDAPVAAAVVLAVVVAMPLTAGFAPAIIRRELTRVRWVVIILAITLLVFTNVHDAVVGTARVLSLLLLAAWVTASTRTEDLLDVIEAAVAPLACIGVRPHRVGLVLLLTISAVPVLGSLARQVRDAQTVRAVPRTTAFVLTLLVLSLRHADDVADSLSVRGVV